MLERLQRKRNPHSLLVEMQTGTATMKTVWWFLKKLTVELPCDPATLLLGIYEEKMKPFICKDICTPIIHCSINYRGQDMESILGQRIGQRRYGTYIQGNTTQL